MRLDGGVGGAGVEICLARDGGGFCKLFVDRSELECDAILIDRIGERRLPLAQGADGIESAALQKDLYLMPIGEFAAGERLAASRRRGVQRGDGD